MNPSAKKLPSTRNDPRVEFGLVQVHIGRRSGQYDHFTDLVWKRAKDILKDDLVRSAERGGGKLFSWDDHGGAFMFPIEGADSFNNCCRAALEMLEQSPALQLEVQQSADLERLMTVRIVCDGGMVACDPKAPNLPAECADKLKQHAHVVSTENKVTITERIFRQLKAPLKSRFVKWKHAPELALDLYVVGEDPATTGLVAADLSSVRATHAYTQATQDGLLPIPAKEHSLARRWPTAALDALKSRTTLGVGAVVLLALVLFGSIRLLAWQTPAPSVAPSVAPSQQPQYLELVQSDEWRNWRKQIHEKLSAEHVTENTLAEALGINLPVRPEHAAAALRRDEAIADVLMAYPKVKDILQKQFGIYEDSFLGTGLSKPNTLSDYGAASVHEYLIPNLADNDPAVWMRILDPITDQIDKTMTVQKLFDAEKPNDPRQPLVNAILERVKDKNLTNPPMIRFARLDLSKYEYSRRLGRPNAYRVFASNLTEVWNTPILEAANLSGYRFAKGEKVYVWAFLPNFPLPNQPGEVVPATWSAVLSNLPQWLNEINKTDK